jgi:multisubunit Na+/H+ antiporter MnhB subunit
MRRNFTLAGLLLGIVSIILMTTGIYNYRGPESVDAFSELTNSIYVGLAGLLCLWLGQFIERRRSSDKQPRISSDNVVPFRRP